MPLIVKLFLKKKAISLTRWCQFRATAQYFWSISGIIAWSFTFLLYVNDLPNAVLGAPTLYADDTCLMLKHSNFSTLQSNLNYQASYLIAWCKSIK